MSPEEREPGSPRDWLKHARSDLALARAKKTRDLLYEHLCFHAQQAAEKAIKAILVQRGMDFPRTHDLAYLLGLLPDDLQLPVSIVDLPVLTKYAVRHRYPGDSIRPTRRQYVMAVDMAEQVIAWVEKVLRTVRS